MYNIKKILEKFVPKTVPELYILLGLILCGALYSQYINMVKRVTQMNIEAFFSKIYTVAFRLTGDERLAGDMSSAAVIEALKELGKNGCITEYTVQRAVLKVCVMFLEEPGIYLDGIANGGPGYDDVQLLQEGLLSLNSVSRVIVIWRDVLGFRLNDILPALNLDRAEANEKLNSGRGQLVEYFAGNTSKIK